MTPDHPKPTVFALYRTGLLASAFAYPAIVLLVTLSFVIDSGNLISSAAMFFWAGIFMALPAVGIAFLITAPLGCLTGAILRQFMPPSRWLGAVNGALVAAVILGLAVLPGALSAGALDTGLLVFVAAVIAICAGAGWLAQRLFLDWPPAHEPFDPETFA